MSAFLALRDAAVAALLVAPAVASGFVRAGRAVPLPAERPEGVFVRLGAHSGIAPFAGDGRVDWESSLILHLMARAPAGGNGETAVDSLLAAVYARLAATPAPGNADGWLIQTAIVYDVDEADQTIGQVELRLRLQHRTASADLDAAD